MKKKTLYDKIYENHTIYNINKKNNNLYVDLHLIHEVTSPQAFEGIKKENRKIRRPEKTFATIDHNVSTISNKISNHSKVSQIQIKTLKKNCKTFNIPIYDLKHKNRGIVHVIAPENGMVLPGMTIVCGDSHTSTHGAFGALSFGIGTSEIQHVLATQTTSLKKFKNMRIKIKGKLKKNVTAKDIILFIIKKIGVSGAKGYVIEFYGETIKNLSMEGRMTICNMAIEMGAKSALIAPDKTTLNYLKGLKFSPKKKNWKKAKKIWKTLKTDKNAYFDKKFFFNINNLKPQITWGTNPGQTISITKKIPDLKKFKSVVERKNAKKSLTYMELKQGQKLTNLSIDKVFIGSCTNSRIEDLREAAKVIKNKKINKKIKAIVVPGSGKVKRQAEKEGLDKIFLKSGFEWRLPGCSMCLAMNDDKLNPKERCASTSNRNFEGRQGRDGRTHLVSPIMAAGAALYGHFIDVTTL